MYADNNDLDIGDTIKVGKDDFVISGLVEFSDYSALFSDPTDLMFDALKFSVAAVTDNAFDHLSGKLHYSYEWKYDKEPKNKIKEKELSDDFMETLYKNTLVKGINIDTYLPRYSNQVSWSIVCEPVFYLYLCTKYIYTKRSKRCKCIKETD